MIRRRTRSSSPEPHGDEATSLATLCEACGLRLSFGVHSYKVDWKACPRCSLRHGKRHVFKPIDDFEYEEQRSGPENDYGRHDNSLCPDCVERKEPRFTGPGVRVCEDGKKD